MASNKKYWRSLEELNDSSLTKKLAAKEFANEIPVEDFLEDKVSLETTNTSRRDFLKILGFSTAAVTLAACQEPVIKSIPYVTKPEEITPGVANYYASSLFDGYDFANVLVKTREGRPIKIEANKAAKYFGTTTARAQASVLSLYDSDRIKQPKILGKETNWIDFDAQITAKLTNVVSAGKKIVLLTSSLPSPSTKGVINQFIQKYPTVQHVVFDSASYSNALDASEEVYGQRVLPLYDLTNTELVVSFNANFLGDWNGGGLESSYATAKKPSASMLRHIQVESNMSLTGASADLRIPVKPSQSFIILAEVYKALNGGALNTEATKIAKELTVKGSKAVVFADGNKEAYILSYLINQKLASSAIVSGKANLLKESNDKVFNQFILDAEAGLVGGIITFQANPVYAHANGIKIGEVFKKIDLTIAISSKHDETTATAKYLAPSPHWLESWGDINPVTGVYTLLQPTIQRIYDTRQFQDSLLTWSSTSVAVVANATEIAPSASTKIINAPYVKSDDKALYYEYLKNFWGVNVLSKIGGISFTKALYNGYNESAETISLNASGAAIDVAVQNLLASKGSELELFLYTKTSIGDGTQANNPWLQELPDPITRTSWDNYLTISPVDSKHYAIENTTTGKMELNGSLVNLTVNGVTIKNIPVFVQPGQAKGSIGLALGYGRKGGKVANGVGVNAYPVFQNSNYSQLNAKIVKVEGEHEFACIQMQNTLMGRYEIARDATLKQFLTEEPEKWNEQPTLGTHKGVMPVSKVDIWQAHDSSFGPHFNLSVDLNSCTGCGACIVACQAENNVAVVGKQEIRNSRDMYWLRIDRYYASDVPVGDTNHDGKLTQEESLVDDLNEPEQYKYLIKPQDENPQVIFQPLMCQHCNHAPCETVCPVAATSHGRQGQNMMAYNRCVGTRYCANNCPYKVRRFNWFNYAQNDKFDFHMNDDLGRMVLNPDVVVRTRGVMEKCSMCVQMTQSIISTAKKENRVVKDGEFQTACTNACSTGSLVFGDINDKQSKISELDKDKRKYVLLEEVGTKPNVMYHVKIRNQEA